MLSHVTRPATQDEHRARPEGPGVPQQRLRPVEAHRLPVAGLVLDASRPRPTCRAHVGSEREAAPDHELVVVVAMAPQLGDAGARIADPGRPRLGRPRRSKSPRWRSGPPGSADGLGPPARHLPAGEALGSESDDGATNDRAVASLLAGDLTGALARRAERDLARMQDGGQPSRDSYEQPGAAHAPTSSPDRERAIRLAPGR